MQQMYNANTPIHHQIDRAARDEYVARWAVEWAATRGLHKGRVVIWGCGDGVAASVFAGAEWNVIGIVRSSTKVSVARSGAFPHDPRIPLVEGDLRCGLAVESGLLAIALGDTLNCLVTFDELKIGWQTLAHSITAGGYVVADVSTPYAYASVWDGRHIITADREDLLVVNRLRYSSTTRIARERVLWFARVNESEEWQRGSETRQQRAHSDAEMIAALESSGLVLVEHFTLHDELPRDAATRIIYIARKE